MNHNSVRVIGIQLNISSLFYNIRGEWVKKGWGNTGLIHDNAMSNSDQLYSGVYFLPNTFYMAMLLSVFQKLWLLRLETQKVCKNGTSGYC